MDKGSRQNSFVTLGKEMALKVGFGGSMNMNVGELSRTWRDGSARSCLVDPSGHPVIGRST